MIDKTLPVRYPFNQSQLLNESDYTNFDRKKIHDPFGRLCPESVEQQTVKNKH